MKKERVNYERIREEKEIMKKEKNGKCILKIKSEWMCKWMRKVKGKIKETLRN